MVRIGKTALFENWLQGLSDAETRYRIEARIERLSRGNPGDVRSVGLGVSELRIHHGPGYRVYFARRGLELIILLAGGDKSTQAKDIKRAIQLAASL